MNSPAMNTTVLKGIVLNIQHFSIHDGPGMRTTVFLKGCSLRCKWCSNPESIHPKPELAYNLSKCIGKDQCGLCLKECPESAIFNIDSDTKVRINWDLCTNCGKCVPVCPPQALYLFGQEMSVDQVLAEVEKAFGPVDILINGAGGSAAAQDRLPPVPWRRARHVVSEIERFARARFERNCCHQLLGSSRSSAT